MKGPDRNQGDDFRPKPPPGTPPSSLVAGERRIVAKIANVADVAAVENGCVGPSDESLSAWVQPNDFSDLSIPADPDAAKETRTVARIARIAVANASDGKEGPTESSGDHNGLSWLARLIRRPGTREEVGLALGQAAGNLPGVSTTAVASSSEPRRVPAGPEKPELLSALIRNPRSSPRRVDSTLHPSSVTGERSGSGTATGVRGVSSDDPGIPSGTEEERVSQGGLSSLIRNRKVERSGILTSSTSSSHSDQRESNEEDTLNRDGKSPGTGNDGENTPAATVAKPTSGSGEFATAIPAIFAIPEVDEPRGADGGTPQVRVFPGIPADGADVSTSARSRNVGDDAAATLATVATIGPGPALPPRWVVAAVRVCREIHGDDETAVQAMLSDLLAYGPEAWSGLIQHFERQLISPSELPEPQPLVTCRRCVHAEYPTHPDITHCRAGIDSGLVTGGFWATDRHWCPHYRMD